MAGRWAGTHSPKIVKASTTYLSRSHALPTRPPSSIAPSPHLKHCAHMLILC